MTRSQRRQRQRQRQLKEQRLPDRKSTTKTVVDDINTVEPPPTLVATDRKKQIRKRKRKRRRRNDIVPPPPSQSNETVADAPPEGRKQRRNQRHKDRTDSSLTTISTTTITSQVIKDSSSAAHATSKSSLAESIFGRSTKPPLPPPPTSPQSSSSLMNSIFGEMTTDTTTTTTTNSSNGFIKTNKDYEHDNGDLFSKCSLEKWERLSQKRQWRNESVLRTTATMVTTTTATKMANSFKSHEITSEAAAGRTDAEEADAVVVVVEKRKERNTSDSSIRTLKQLTVPIPPFLDHGKGEYKIKKFEVEKEEEKDGKWRDILRPFVGRSDSIFRQNGVLLLSPSSSSTSSFHTRSWSSSVFAKGTLETLSRRASEIEGVVIRRLDEMGRRLWNKKNDNDNLNHKMKKEEESHDIRYYEVASRCRNRLDIRYFSSDSNGTKTRPLLQPITTDPDVISNPYLMPIVHSLLGDKDARLVYVGLILSFPHSADQPWHRDGTALFKDDEMISSCCANIDEDLDGNGLEKVWMDLPPYALNVFVPLEDITEEMGPTEFYVGSHKGERKREIERRLDEEGEEGLMMDDYGAEEDNEDIVNGKGGGVFGPCVRRGEVLLYDYRVCHRGTSNLSYAFDDGNGSGCEGKGRTRRMLYLMYARPWFREHLNFGNMRLFPNTTIRAAEVETDVGAE